MFFKSEYIKLQQAHVIEEGNLIRICMSRLPDMVPVFLYITANQSETPSSPLGTWETKSLYLLTPSELFITEQLRNTLQEPDILPARRVKSFKVSYNKRTITLHVVEKPFRLFDRRVHDSPQCNSSITGSSSLRNVT